LGFFDLTIELPSWVAEFFARQPQIFVTNDERMGLAIALAQKKLGRYDIGDEGRSHYTLVASTEPCAMCFGALPWSGVTRLVCGARDEDARKIGFDEGPKLPDWQEALQQRGIRVTRDVLRLEAVAVLELYTDRGGPIYNAGSHE
jgi:hypothetical protein